MIVVATGSGGSAITGPSGKALVKARTWTCGIGVVWCGLPVRNVTTRPEMVDAGPGCVPDPDPAAWPQPAVASAANTSIGASG